MNRLNANWILAAIFFLVAAPIPVARVRGTEQYSIASGLVETARQQLPKQSLKRLLRIIYPQARIESVSCDPTFISRLDHHSLFQRPPPFSL